jgi:hypothetical protein
MSDRFTQTRAEVTDWFFEDYLPRWVSASSGATDESPEFILDYWGVPMHVSLPDKSTWFLDAKGVLSFLEMNRAPLKAAGYTHTVVPDSRVFVYNIVGAAVEVIWSRRRADDSEIQRWAVHFEVAKSDQGWRVVGIQSTATDTDTLSEIWPRSPGREPVRA